MTVSKFRVYEVVCRDKSIQDRYIGYTSMTKQVREFWRWRQNRAANVSLQVFIDCQNGIIRDENGKRKDLGDKKQAPSRLQQFVMSHGGWSNWDFRVRGFWRAALKAPENEPLTSHSQVFPRLWDSASEANLIKEIIINKRPGKYTLNIYKTGKKRAAPTTMEGYDSDEESVATDN